MGFHAGGAASTVDRCGRDPGTTATDVRGTRLAGARGSDTSTHGSDPGRESADRDSRCGEEDTAATSDPCRVINFVGAISVSSSASSGEDRGRESDASGARSCAASADGILGFSATQQRAFVEQ